ncbi:DUF4142 domain-containing protein [Pollutibacter soli]|uniref:DUF4142 domain-containing protein n=1 Tax=Pollutibacter soli TaxID=3034157 RepID=UPI0030135773
MIATGANNVKLLFGTLFITAFSLTASKISRSNDLEATPGKSHFISAARSVAEDTSFLVKAIKFHQQQVMLADIADKKLTDTSLKRIASQIRVDHQTALGELFKLYKSTGSTSGSDLEKRWNDSLIADRTNDLSKEEKKVSDMAGVQFTNRWIGIVLREYDHIIPEFQSALHTSMNEKLRNATSVALTNIKENRKELNNWRSGNQAAR